MNGYGANLAEDMMRNLLTTGMLVAVLTACSGGADQNNDGKISADEASKEMASGGAMKMKPGMWETTISFSNLEAKGMPDAAKKQMLAAMGKGVTVKSCLTKEQVEKPGSEFFGTPKEANCDYQQLDRSGNNMKIAMTCKPDGKTVVTSTMDGSFSDESYSMTMQQKTSGTPMGDMDMSGKIEGKRLGDCPA
jgi:Protein of unknown function (DUF3617)